MAKVNKSQRKNLKGKIFGRLLVLEEAPDRQAPNGNNISMWKCQCECGNIIEIRTNSLTSGNTKSCGCINREIALENCLKNLKRSIENPKRNRYNLAGEYGIGYTYKNQEFYFDLEDYDLIKDYSWYKDSRGYIVSTIRVGERQTSLKMHRLITNAQQDEEVDHIFHNTVDNRKSQLSKGTHFENMHNKKKLKNNKTGVAGVVETKHGKFSAQVANKEKFYLGLFDTIEEARDARLKFKEEHNMIISNADRGIPD